jgi:hypothetical protein
MRRRLFVLWAGLLGLALVGAASTPAGRVSAAGFHPGQQNPTVDSGAHQAAGYRGVLDKYCVTCHNERLRTAGLALNRVDPSALDRDGEIWEKVLGKLERRTMPPAGSPRPDETTYREFASWLASSLDAAAVVRPNPGRPGLHRLNRTEYANAVRDLLSLEIDVAALLPPDDSTRGFDNIADALGISPLLFESYLVAARKVSRLAVGNPTLAPISETYWVARDETQDYQKDGLPFGTRGGLRVRHHFPLDGEYDIRIRLSKNHADLVRGLQEPGHDLEFALDGERVKLFTLDGGRHMYAQEYFDAKSLALTADEGLNLRIAVKAGPHDVSATFPMRTNALTEDLMRPRVRAYVSDGETRGMPEISRIIVAGPFNASGATETPARRRLFTCRPDRAAAEISCAKNIISHVARRAYRGLVTDADVEDLLGFYNTARKSEGFEQGIEAALTRMLASPKFLFRFEFDPRGIAPGVAYQISDGDLASRLSFMLWSSIPDDPLLEAAARGDLRHPAMLERQVRRMLADTRARALVDNFAGQWLYLRNLESVLPDKGEFPEFDNNLRQAFRRETELLFESIMREDRSVLDLLNADYTFVNERLARHYGMSNVHGSEFRRVSVADENRRGILGHGSILTVTSHANRTSPVIRGKWVLENLLGAPPPLPPANVPELAATDKTGAVLSMRERMAQHRANAVCASCHKVMDPIGFGLENFNAVGGWRRTDGTTPIDASGTLPNGVPFEGPAGLRKALMQQPDGFVNTMAGKLLTYGLGRGVEYYDGPAIRAITREAARNNYSFSSLILGIVKSVPFRMRCAPEKLPQPTTVAAQRP